MEKGTPTLWDSDVPMMKNVQIFQIKWGIVTDCKDKSDNV